MSSPNRDKYIIYFAGGTMRGVFSTGVATAFKNKDLYPNITSIYSASAGAMTGAYFLSRQIELGASIYWEDLGSDFIYPKYLWVGIWQRFQNRFLKKVSKENMRDPLNIAHLMWVVEKKKQLDTERILSQNIPLNIKLLNIDTHSVEYIDARRTDILKILEASVSPLPYTHKIFTIDGKKYIDGAIVDIIGIEYLKEKHPDSKIIIVLNGQTDGKLRHKLKNWVESRVMMWMFQDVRLSGLYVDAEKKLGGDLEVSKNDPRITIIEPEKDTPMRSRTTQKELLMATYEMGIRAGEKALEKINKEI